MNHLRSVNPRQPSWAAAPAMLISLIGLAAASTVGSASPRQDGDGTSAQAAPAAVSSAAVGLQKELDALNSMNSAAGELIESAKSRIVGIDAFLKEKNLSSGYSDFASTDKPVVPAMSFNSAYTEALNSEKLNGTSRVTSTDLGLLAREISATTTLVHETWANLNGLMTQVATRTDFLQAQKLFDDYQDWAPGYHKAQVAAAQAQAAELRSKAIAADKARDAQINAKMADLKSQWDKVAYSCSGIDYNYHFSQSVAQPGAFSQTASTGAPGFQAQTGTAGSGAVAGGQPAYTNPTYGDIMVPGLYEGPNYGQNLQGGYYGGSLWNTYGDPYYDVMGYPSGWNTGAWDGPYGRSGIHNSFNRSTGALPRTNPGFHSAPAAADGAHR